MRFWREKWIDGSENIEDSCLGNIPMDQAKYPVSFYFDNGRWKWDSFESFIPNSARQNIEAVNPPNQSNLGDFPPWSLNSDGNFSLKYAYVCLTSCRTVEKVENPLFKKIWHWKGPNMIRAFLWKIIHGKLLTNQERQKRGMRANPMCPRCNSSPETLMHMLRNCDEVFALWNEVLSPNSWIKFFSIGLYPWIEWNLSSNGIGRTPWS